MTRAAVLLWAVPGRVIRLERLSPGRGCEKQSLNQAQEPPTQGHADPPPEMAPSDVSAGTSTDATELHV